MKKHELLEIHFQQFDDFTKEVRRALEKRAPLIQSKNQVTFDSVASFRNFMTIQKIELLTIIATQKPSSVYGLARLVGRDFAAVLRDCASLESTGFILLKETKNARKTKIPQLKFNYVGIAVFLPKVPYRIEFKAAS